MNIIVILVLFLVQASQAPFTRFTYCREFPSGIYEKQCIELKPDGTGQSRVKQRGAEEMPAELTLSAQGREKFLSVIAATRNLADRDRYETKKKVANLGQKHLVLELASETRKADFNYSDLKEVNALASFFDGLINQRTLISDIETAVRYQRLTVPERLDQLDAELKGGRIGDPQGLVPVLDKLIQDERILEYARQHAQQMKSQLSVGK